jgi:hypothetical protein
MTEKSWIWPTTGSGDVSPISVADTAAIFAALFLGTNPGRLDYGVIPGLLNELAPVVSGTNILVATGWALVDGHPYRNDATKTVTPVVPTVGTTGRRLVLRASWSAGVQTVRITEISSADGTAAIPAMTQTSGTTYDVPICSYTVATGGGAIGAFTDTRSYAGSDPIVAARRQMRTGRVNLINWRATHVFEAYDPTDMLRQLYPSGGLIFSSYGSSSNYYANMSVGGLIATLTGPNVALSSVGVHTGYASSGSANFATICAPDRSPFARIRMNPTGTGAAAVNTRVYGFVSSVSVGGMATASGAYLRRNTTGNLFSVTRQGGSETTTDLGVQSNAQRWYDIWTPDAGATWYFYDYTGALQATHTTNLPTPSTDLGFAAMLEQNTAYQSHQVSALWVDMVDE